MRISDWSSDVCSSDLNHRQDHRICKVPVPGIFRPAIERAAVKARAHGETRSFARDERRDRQARSEEHTSELQSLMRISYAVFCLKKKTSYQTMQQRSRP